jgi:hypothetical protein
MGVNHAVIDPIFIQYIITMGTESDPKHAKLDFDLNENL